MDDTPPSELKLLRLEDRLNDLAVIRTTFETMELFPAGDSIHSDMFSIIREAKVNLLVSLGKICDGIQANPTAFPFAPPLDYVKFKPYAIEMMEHGYPVRLLNGMMKTNVFDGGESTLYYFDAAGFLELEEARQMPAHLFTLLLFNEVLQSASDEANYADKPLFERKVYQKYMAILFLCYATTDPMFYGIHRRQG